MINNQPESSTSRDYFNTDDLRSDLKTRALRGASVTIIIQAFAFGIGTIGTIILARRLTPNDFGLVTMVLSFSLLLQSVGGNGFIEVVVQRKEIHHRQISTLFWINAAFSFVLMLLFMASAPVIAWFYKEPLLKPIVVVMAASVLFGGLSSQHQALLYRRMEFFKASIIELIAVFISIVTAIALACLGWGYWALVAKWVISPLVITISAWSMCRWRPGAPSRGTGVRYLLRFVLNSSANFVMSHFRRYVDKVLIGRFVSSQALGSYDRAYHLSLMLPNQLIAPLNSVSVATFSRLSDDPEKYRNSYLKTLSILSFICFPLSAALTLVGKDLLLLLLGPQWSLAGQIFAVFGVSIGLMMIYSTHSWIHLSLGTTDRWLRWGIIAFIVTVLLFIIGLQFGAIGVAVAYSSSFYILTAPALWYAGRPINLRIHSIFSALWKYYVSALVSGLMCWFILYSYDLTSDIFINMNILLRIIISVIFCILLYLVLIVALYRSFKPISQFISYLREIIPKRSEGK